ncbi:putative polyketide synthase protein [Zalerion maritima]|uniref:Polyketide synthase protein n=1 Tax=Zalerion maritima TaxID=339359 RepID=A0AAD5RGU5_9PEZI|nr:putative polyketide synthase protein [Zalerion maritima]
MANRMAYLLFGDQSLSTHAFLADFCRQGNAGILAKTFLDLASSALREEIESLGRLQRSRLPTFRTLPQLNERYHQQKIKHSGVDSALLCVSQLVHYIDRAEKEYEDIVKADHTFLAGLCTGLFAASAIACTSSPSSLIPLAVQTVLMAFRTGSHVDAMAGRLCPSSGSSESWTTIMPGTTREEAEAAISDFHNVNAIPVTSKAYISAISSGSVAISGPPSTLDALFEQEFFTHKPRSIPVFGPYHASHIHGSSDIKKILRLGDPELQKVFTDTKPKSAVISCTTGSSFAETETSSLFRAVVHEMLNEPLMFSDVLKGCVNIARDFQDAASDIGEVLIIPFGPTQSAETLANTIRSQTEMSVILRKAPKISPEGTLGSIGRHGSTGKCKLAIVGMAGRFPDAASHEKLWELLEKGLDVHRTIPKDRFNVETHYDPTGKAINTSHSPVGCWIENPGHFDPRFFNMSPREAYQTDPMQRMALTTAYEALEMSGYVPNRTPSTRLDRIGTFYGQTSDDWREINAAQEVDTYYITGGVRAFGPGRINYHLGFSGPSFNVDTACSSSAAALQLACTSLWAKDCDTAVVGGLSCMTNPDIFAGLSRGQFLSKTHNCNTFDNDADGYCRADGCASVIVKRLDDAIADKDNILAVVLGTATNHSADAVSITHPHGPTQSILSSTILDDAGVDPHDVDYVEMHGTGTQAGDGTEMASVTSVFAPADRKRPADRPLYLGAVKSNIGHGEAASGVTALCKVLMMLKKDAIPPHVGIKKTMNKTFPADLSERNVNIAFHLTPFQRRDGKPRRVFVNNFSAAGGNTGLLLEDAPKCETPAADPRPVHVVTVTAKSKSSMIRNAENLVGFMERNPDTPVCDVAYSTTARRIQHYWRMNVAVSSLEDAQSAIKQRLASTFTPVSAKEPKVAFLFTGQGSHYAAMGKDLYAHYSIFRDSIDEFDQLARIHGFPSFIPLIDGSERDLEKLSPVVVQLGMSCFEMALARLWNSWGVKPAVVLGHSLGEYAALHVAGVLSASDTIYLVGARAQLLVDRCTAGTHTMLAVQGDVKSVTGALTHLGALNIACINGPRATVLSGERDEMAQAAESLSAAGFKTTQLSVPFAFHSAQVDPILEEFEHLARSIPFKKPSVSVISPLLGKLLEDEPVNGTYLANHAREAVDFLGGLVSAQESGVIDEKTVWLEVGPHPVCSAMVKATFGAATIACPTVRKNEETYKTLSSTLCTFHTAGLNMDWNEFHRDFDGSVRLLDLPTYSFEDKNYWLQYEGDWCLTKNRIASAARKAIEPAKPKLSTASVHTVTLEEVKGDVAIIETESELTREDLKRAVSGHLVNGAALCPSSLYADMAVTVCDYAYKLIRPDANIGLNVGSMEVDKPLILAPNTKSHVLRLRVEADIKRGTANLKFTSETGGKHTDHAESVVYFEDKSKWQAEWDRVSFMVKGRIDALKRMEQTGEASKIGRGLAYRLFAALVDYTAAYRGMEEVTLDSANSEATAKIVFQNKPEDGNFVFAPYWIDSLCHISGFIINATDSFDARETAYISHGWETMRFSEIPDASKTYRSYVRMQPVRGSTIVAGDVYVFDEAGNVVGQCGDIKFKAIPRKVMNMILPPVGGAAPAKAAAPAKSKATSKPASKPKSQKLTAASLASVNKRLVSVVGQIMDIIAKESGVTHDELCDNIEFANIGVDSLMALTICGRIREDLEVDIDSHAFIDYASIGEFKGFINKFERRESTVTVDSYEASSQSDTPDSESDSNVTTPLDESDTGSLKGDTSAAAESSGDLQSVIRSTIAEEMSMDVDEIIAAPNLADLGMDSLMSLTILGKLREETGLDISPQLFEHNSSIADVEKALGVGPPKARPVPKKTVSFQEEAPPSKAGPITVPTPLPNTMTIDEYPHRKARSTLLQGKVRTATRNLFMIPDGSGSATSYTELSQIGGDVAVWGLFSPFMTTPAEYKCGVPGMATKFIEEVKKRQPQGPYSFGGWSAGGVIAYEMVNQLLSAGEKVDNLILLDSPCPTTIEPLPNGLHAWFAEVGLMGDMTGGTGKVPDWLIPHFAASVTALSSYAKVVPELPRGGEGLNMMVIWCEDGVCGADDAPKPDPYPSGHALFLLENKTDFGPAEWDTLATKANIQLRQMPGTHFSMMHGSLALQLGGFVKEALQI